MGWLLARPPGLGEAGVHGGGASPESRPKLWGALDLHLYVWDGIENGDERSSAEGDPTPGEMEQAREAHGVFSLALIDALSSDPVWTAGPRAFWSVNSEQRIRLDDEDHPACFLSPSLQAAFAANERDALARSIGVLGADSAEAGECRRAAMPPTRQRSQKGRL